MKKVKIISWNVNGIRACYKKNLSAFISKEKPDILCLQETKAYKEQVEHPVQTLCFANSIWSSAQRKGYSGTATFFHESIKNYQLGIDIEKYDQEGRFVITEHPQFDLYNIYFPNGGSGEERHLFKQNFLQDFLAHLQEQLSRGRNLIVVGDYNIAHTEIDVYDPVRLANESGFLPEERAWMDSFYQLGFVDSFRYFHPTEKGRYSWWSYRERARQQNRGWRIDYICVSEGLKKHLYHGDLLDSVEGSDHCPIIAELEF